jgi:tetratricopeptide (TPR) repeat protein
MVWQNRSIVLLLAVVTSAASDLTPRARADEEIQARQAADTDSAPPSTDPDAAQAAAKCIEAGRAAHAASDLEQAIAKFGEALRLAPSPQAYGLRGRAYAEHGDDSQAWSDFDRAIELDPTQAEAFAARSWLRAMRGEYEQGFADVNEAIRLDPKRAEAYVTRAALFRYTARKELSDADDRSAKRIDPTALEFRLPKGIFWGDPRRDARAIVAKCDEAIKGNERNFAAYMNRGFAHYLLGEHQQSIDDYTAALLLNPTYSQAYNYRATSYMRLLNHAQAIADLSQAIHFDPGFKWPYINRAAAWRALGLSGPALEDVSKALVVDPRFNYALRYRMILYIERRNFDAALTDANALLAIQPEDWSYSFWAYYHRAQCWLERMDYAAAISDLDEIVRRTPNDAQFYAARAWVYFKWGKIEEAVAEDAAARRLDPRYGRDYQALAGTDRASQNRSPLLPTKLPAAGEAEAAVDKAIREYRAHPDSDDRLVCRAIDQRLQAGQGRLPVRYLEKLLRSAPDDRATAMAVAVCLGIGYPDDPPLSVARLQLELLDSPHEPVRSRAAESVAWRASTQNLTDSMAELLAPGVKMALEAEKTPDVRKGLSAADAALKTLADGKPKP